MDELPPAYARTSAQVQLQDARTPVTAPTRLMRPRCVPNRARRAQGVMPDPIGSIFYEKWANDTLVKPKSFEVEGVGKDSIPGALDLKLVDAMPRFSDEQAFTMCRKIARTNGMMVGGSSGGNVHSAIELARTLKGPATVVAVMPDSGVKYLSKIFNDEWMDQKGYKNYNA